jgi:hypothetical protein
VGASGVDDMMLLIVEVGPELGQECLLCHPQGIDEGLEQASHFFYSSLVSDLEGTVNMVLPILVSCWQVLGSY